MNQRTVQALADNLEESCTGTDLTLRSAGDKYPDCPKLERNVKVDTSAAIVVDISSEAIVGNVTLARLQTHQGGGTGLLSNYVIAPWRHGTAARPSTRASLG